MHLSLCRSSYLISSNLILIQWSPFLSSSWYLVEIGSMMVHDARWANQWFLISSKDHWWLIMVNDAGWWFRIMAWHGDGYNLWVLRCAERRRPVPSPSRTPTRQGPNQSSSRRAMRVSRAGAGLGQAWRVTGGLVTGHGHRWWSVRWIVGMAGDWLMMSGNDG